MIRKEKTEKREISNQWEESNADGRMDRRPNISRRYVRRLGCCNSSHPLCSSLPFRREGRTQARLLGHPLSF